MLKMGIRTLCYLLLVVAASQVVLGQRPRCRGTCDERTRCREGLTCVLRKGSRIGDCCPFKGPLECDFTGQTCDKNRKCDVGSYCKRPDGTIVGKCCKETCPYGQYKDAVCGGEDKLLCPKGSTCMFMTGGMGKCCIGMCPPESGLPGTCEYDPNVNCLTHMQCPAGQFCCQEGCNKVCKQPVLPWK